MNTDDASLEEPTDFRGTAELFDGLLRIVEAQKRRFPKGLDPFKMVTRLLEECGELATEVQIWEDEGLKRAKHGDPDRDRIAGEIVNVLTATLTIADHYDLIPVIARRAERAVDAATADGHIEGANAAPLTG